ncbi:AMP-binding enzyme [Massilia alkalitolerans]|uniref:AMP-binding enzyme n=1 Tax=Massilia alkalitolerans TaxID=286638 RepID=UPI0003FB00C3|nr:AMP-binding protein [Massilia alkalitolerans]
MTVNTVPEPRWWRHQASLLRVLSDLLAGELALMRPGIVRRPPPWPPELDLMTDLGADSLELLGLATAMEQVLGIGCIGEERVLANPRLGAWLEAAASGLEHGSGTINFRTSGSSGAPKACSHALASLWQETGALAALFPGTRRIVGLVPSHHIYGFLFTVLLPRALGLDPAATVDLRGASPGAVARQLAPGDLVVGFPDFWRAFAPVAGALPAGVTGVSSTAPCPDEVARAVMDAGLARLVQVYGSSETAGVGWRNSPDEDYRLFPYWEAGMDGAQLERCGADDRRRSFALQDRLAWSAPGRFRPMGRIDHAVQVGGVNVFPGYVADVLRMHPKVADASVRAMRPDEGRRLKAFVVPRAGAPLEGSPEASALRAELGAWMAERLSTPERPAAYSFGAALPRQASGKLSDWIIDAGA